MSNVSHSKLSSSCENVHVSRPPPKNKTMLSPMGPHVIFPPLISKQVLLSPYPICCLIKRISTCNIRHRRCQYQNSTPTYVGAVTFEGHVKNSKVWPCLCWSVNQNLALFTHEAIKAYVKERECLIIQLRMPSWLFLTSLEDTREDSKLE